VVSPVVLQIYVIGSNTKLGQWKVENGLKLSYAGEYVWLAESVIQRSDFPIRYPF
jgi:4-alpha-glucanotransferase